MVIHKIAPVLKRHPLILELVLAPLAMMVLYLCAFAKFVFGDRNLSTFQDNTYLLHPIFHHISNSFSHGEYPYWMNTIVAGLPLYNSPQFSPNYPLYFLQSGLYSTPLNASIDMMHVVLFHFFIIYVNTYVMLRVFRLSPIPALLGASLFAFSPSTVSYGFWVNSTAAYSWFPLVMASVFLVLENRRARLGVLLGVSSLSLLTLAAPAQPLIHAVFIIGVLYFFYALRYLKNRDMRTVWRVTRNLFVLGILTFLTASPSILPVLLETRTMIRFLGEYPAIVGNAKIPFNAFLVGQLEPSHLAAALLPLQIPLIIGNPFVGISAVLLALFAVFKIRTNFVVLPILLIALYGLLSATGSHLGFAQFNYHLPLINKMREPGRHLILFVFGASTLAAFGFAYLIQTFKGEYRALVKLKHVIVIVIFLGLLITTLNARLPYIGLISKGYLLGTGVLSLGLLFTLRWVAGWKHSFIVALAALLIIYATLQYPMEPPRWQDGDYFTAANLVSHEVLGELARIEDVRNYRFIFNDEKLNPQFWSMNASYYGLRSFQAYMNPLPNEQFNYIFQRFNTSNYYPLLGAKYYLCNPCINEKLMLDYEFMTEIKGYKLNVAKKALSRYSIMNRLAGSYASPDDFLGKINAGGYDYTKAFYVRDNDFAKVADWLGNQSASSTFLKEESASLNSIKLSVNTQERAVFILNEFFNRVWKARVNGVAVKLIPVNANQIGVLLEKGANLVEFEYHPTLFIRLLWLQRLVILCLALYVLFGWATSTREFLKTRRTQNKAGLSLDREAA